MEVIGDAEELGGSSDRGASPTRRETGVGCGAAGKGR